MEGAIGSGLLEPISGCVHGLSGSSERTCSQRLDVLGVTYLRASVNDFLSSFEELLSEVSELEDLSVDERVAESPYCAIDNRLVRLSVLEYALLERRERGLGSVARSRP